ncbi:DegT/DnrJ/EryC1/StrS family aminotransferase [Candidatus Pelagibacter sp.]|nr:DegT/DnrJ/EryC1/StrS family aminotransferase [Candidatus Pelagibacter sp.]
MKKFNHQLMENNITQSDKQSMIKFIKKSNIFTQSKNVEEFERQWSKWLGVKYSVFVNSGSSANFISISTLKYLNKDKLKNEIIVPPFTWISDVSSIILNNFKPVFVDINLKNLSMDEEEIKKKISKKTLAVFLTHAQGFNGLSSSLINFLKKKKVILLEDVCESHGAKFNSKKLGTFGLISNFSFYYAHHMSTIEGGMVCTNNKQIYLTARMLRAHGLLRETKDKKYIGEIIKKNISLSPQFIFMHPTLNFRNNEIQAIIGLNQLKRLDRNNQKRSENFIFFLKNLDEKKYFKEFDTKGSCNYALPIILKKDNIQKRNNFEKELKKYNIEFRRGSVGGGNQLRQPYLKNLYNIDFKKFRNVEHMHHFGYYIGNFPSLKKNKIKQICKILNKI